MDDIVLRLELMAAEVEWELPISVSAALREAAAEITRLRSELEAEMLAVRVLARKAVRHFEWENMLAVQQGENRIELPLTGNAIADCELAHAVVEGDVAAKAVEGARK